MLGFMASTLDLLKNIYLPFDLEESEGEGEGEGGGGGDCCLREKIETTPKNEEVDRISELPNQVLHHILSLLDMKEVVQTMFLSKRWKDVWRFGDVDYKGL
ncbi:hypothetical protein FRX31_003609 [Thalictrum thalictroides]|uniref:F-box domain-containing protein n=1 Tax=Thalictrum thalictroides TaxID=46969 RepID=A0A7J6XD63_THATH|nr:hypothetical protein FRX31_003609 [Thalictrum thalictroides]